MTRVLLADQVFVPVSERIVTGNTNPATLHLNGMTTVYCQGCSHFFGYNVKDKRHTVLDCLQEFARQARERDY